MILEWVVCLVNITSTMDQLDSANGKILKKQSLLWQPLKIDEKSANFFDKSEYPINVG